jgi:hypothetical protein
MPEEKLLPQATMNNLVNISPPRNLSAGSADTGFCGSMEKEKRKKVGPQIL